jgi:hypothetical protein
MKSVKYSEEKHKEEKKENELALIEAKRADDYYERIKHDQDFQKYVVEAIFRKSIARLSDNREIGKMIKVDTSKEEIADIMMLSIKASAELEKILGKLIN